VVKSSSKKLRSVVCSLTIRLFAAGLLRSGEKAPHPYNTTEAFQDARNKRKKQETFS
jgi:hypothetical protein